MPQQSWLMINADNNAYRTPKLQSSGDWDKERAPNTSDMTAVYGLWIQQASTDMLYTERSVLRQRLANLARAERGASAGQHPEMSRLQLIEQELNRRGRTWPTAEPSVVIGNPAPNQFSGPQPIRRYNPIAEAEAKAVPPMTPIISEEEANAVSEALTTASASTVNRDMAIGAVAGLIAAYLADKSLMAGLAVGTALGYFVPALVNPEKRQ